MELAVLLLLLEHAVLVQIFLSDALFRGVGHRFPGAWLHGLLNPGALFRWRLGKQVWRYERSARQGRDTHISCAWFDIQRIGEREGSHQRAEVFGMSPTTVSITAPLSIQALLAMVVLLQYKTDDSDGGMETGYTVTSKWPIVGR